MKMPLNYKEICFYFPNKGETFNHQNLFGLILFFTSTQQSFSYAGRSSWVEPVLS